MRDRIFVLRISLSMVLVVALLFPLPSIAVDLDKGRIEVAGILDGIFNRHFRRSMRVRAALHECKLDEQADALAPTDEERSRGVYDFTREIGESESVDVKAYVASISSAENETDTLEAIYSAALLSYFRGVLDGASGSLIWVDDDDKKKLCAYMVEEAKGFLRLRKDVS